MDRIGILIAFPAYDAIIAAFYTIPAFITIHTPETALNRSDPGISDFFAFLVQLFDKAGAAGGRHITPVQEAV